MTAEVAIMNRAAVSMAADSAITIECDPKEVRTIPKIYTTINKLFALSKYRPVGIMVYGSADMLGRPWEPIIKIYRRRLSDGRFNSLEDYAVDFARYLGNRDIFPTGLQEDYYHANVSAYYGIIAEEIQNTVKGLFEADKKPTSTEIANAVSNAISGHHSQIRKLKYVRGMNSKTVEKFRTKYSSILAKAIASAFEKLTMSKENLRQLQEIGCYLYTKEKFPPRGTSGMVIAGFGEKDIFPSLIEYEVETVVDDKLKYREKGRYCIDVENTAVIYPFAQYDVVHTFLKGIDPSYRNVLEGYLSELLDKYPEHIVEALPDIPKPKQEDIAKRLKRSGKKLLDEYRKNMNDYCQRNYVNPVVESVASLPKTELADMAEALVSLTSFKRRMSAEAETVAGPIDVALISKGDGFIWIKRKHYFKPELNYSFFQNYFRE